MRRLVFGAAVAVLLAGCLATPTLKGEVVLLNGTVEPLPPDKASLVRVTADVAASTVLTKERDTGWPDPDIAWQSGGCVLVGWFEGRPMSYSPDPGPPSAVYLVRLANSLTRDVTWVMVDATTGELRSAIGNPE